MGTVRFLAAAILGVAFASNARASVADGQPIDGIAVLLRRLEPIVQAADSQGFASELTDSADRSHAIDFATLEFGVKADRTVIQERDREPLRGSLPGEGFRIIVDVFTEYGNRSRVGTWRLDLKRVGDAGEEREWAIADEERLSSLENLYRLSLNPAKQFAARDLKIGVEDLDLTLTEGTVFVAEVDLGVTGLVLTGKGSLRFHPDPITEKGQIRIFCGNDTLETSFDSVFIRLNPIDYELLVSSASLQAQPVDPRELKRAQDLFKDESVKSFIVDLGDLSRDPWTLLPGPTDFLAEIHTRKFDTLTYAKSGTEAEDITVFDRKHHRNISIYQSKGKLAAHGRFYNEDELVDYDVLDYDIDVASTPDRQWIEGRARLFIKVRSFVMNNITLKLADSLTVQSIVSSEQGRLFGVRIKNQNSVIVNLPVALARDSTLTLTVTYSGRLPPQAPDRETVALDEQGQRTTVPSDDLPLMSPEPSYLYSSRSLWYPQAVVSDYATARIRLTVPSNLDAVASGQLEPGSPVLVAAKDSKDPTPLKQYSFVASQPLRYLAFIVSRFSRAETATIGFPETPVTMTEGVPLQGISYRSLSFGIETNPRQASRARDLADRVADIATFYQSIIGDSPYSSFTVALVESELPGGHSPAYFASLNQPLPFNQLVWRNDPAAFNNFPEFFIAHEMAHQWWGQAVGWRNYHEQWISEGFAQYFAALYAQHARGDEAFYGVMRQLRRWGMDQSDQGPVYLGYRLGHIRNESRIFRALVYNKSAAVLHMLRGFVGDEAFFAGIRRFYRTNRFKKAGTEDFRAAMEASSGQSLERFFERWIYGSSIPRVKLAYTVNGNEAVLHVEQLGEEIFDFPLILSLQYADRKPVDVTIHVTDRSTEARVPLTGALRGVEPSKDASTLADITKS
jgi:hypothetical protein